MPTLVQTNDYVDNEPTTTTKPLSHAAENYAKAFPFLHLFPFFLEGPKTISLHATTNPTFLPFLPVLAVVAAITTYSCQFTAIGGERT